MGSKIHDKLEDIVKNKTSDTALLNTLQEELSDLDLLNIDFPKDNRGGTSIRDNWIKDMMHFCMNFISPSGEFTTEEFVLYKMNEDRYVQGYIDLIKHNADGSISIYDWKTSTNFSAEDLLHHGRQLIIYAMAKEQEGYTVKNIAWIMLKYVEITFMGRVRNKETQIKKVVNRGKIVSELKPYIEADLAALVYDDVDIELMIGQALRDNSLNKLPQQIQDKYIIKPYVRNYSLTDDLKAEAVNYINTYADLFESKTDDEKEWLPRNMTKPNGKEDTWKCNVLCNHRETCKYIKKYNELKAITNMADDELF